MGDVIASVQDRQAASQRLDAFIAASATQEGVAWLQGLQAAAPDFEWMVGELQGIGCIELGQRAGDVVLIGRGVQTLRSLANSDSVHTQYNIANGELALWEVPMRGATDDLATQALLRSVEHLHTARAIYERIGEDVGAPDDVRVQCLVNAGNSYDTLGRDIEALELWRRALEIRPGFAMAHGNRGIALLHAGATAGKHQAALRAEACWELDQALADPDGVLTYGSPSALEHFRQQRALLPADVSFDPGADREPFRDPHLRWCLEHELFLHLSHRCLREDQQHLDELGVSRMNFDLDDGTLDRIADVLDAVNALKQEYATVRMSTWMAIEPKSPIRELSDTVRGRVHFAYSPNYGRWGTRTGLLVQTFTSATNLLDKIAVFAHAYFNSPRAARKIYFRGFYRTKAQDGQVRLEDVFRDAFAAGWNPGLVALCDLANDLDEDTALKRLVQLRNAATHRLLVVHETMAPDSSPDWLTRVDYGELVHQSMLQMRLIRGALVYLMRAVDRNEGLRDETQRGDGQAMAEGPPIRPVDPDHTEID